MVGRERRTWLPRVTALLVALAVGLAFWLPAHARAGAWPAPLDDVYIYYGFARSTALGEPLSWVPGNGYSSGATSVLYPLLLAPFWAVGLRGPWLGIGAALLAVVLVADFASSLATVAGPSRRARLARAFAPLLVVACPLLDWSLFSGMETALFAAVLGRALVAADRAVRSPPDARRSAQLGAGVWLALLPLARPESLVLSACLGLAIVHGAGSLGSLGSLVRTLAPVTAALASQLAVNFRLTGEWQAAGALRKLLTAIPRIAPSTLVLEYGKNLVVLVHQAFVRALGGPAGLAAVGVLLVGALILPLRRRLAAALVVGAVGTLLVVSLNATARFQNYRYAAPSLLMVLAASTIGVAALTGRARARNTLVSALATLVCLAPLGEWPKQREHFARASRNIAEQQGEIGRRLAAMSPRPSRVLVADAGAIPYLSTLPALDALGLGGYRDLPFARASLEGEAAVVELLERMPMHERPDVMALYPGWWPLLSGRFGLRIDSVRIVDNVICAADEKVIYRSDFATLAVPGEAAWPGSALEIDLADLVDERANEVQFMPESPPLVWQERLEETGPMRWDAGRALALHDTLTFRVSMRLDGRTEVLARSHRALGPMERVRIAVHRAGRIVERSELSERSCLENTHWCTLVGAVEARTEDLIEITPESTTLELHRLGLRALATP